MFLSFPIMSQSKRQAQKNRNLRNGAQSTSVQVDYSNMPIAEILGLMAERNTDPEISKTIDAVVKKFPDELSKLSINAVESEKRGRSLVISGLPEAEPNTSLTAKRKDLEEKVSGVLEVLQVDCYPLEVYRMGKPGGARPRLVKIVMPSKSYWAAALSNAYKLRGSDLRDVYIRKSMTESERKEDFELRKECRDRNAKLNYRKWVVYRGAITDVDDLPSSRVTGNSQTSTASFRV